MQPAVLTPPQTSSKLGVPGTIEWNAFLLQSARVGLWCFQLKIFLHSLIYLFIRSLTKHLLLPWDPQAPVPPPPLTAV